MSSDILDNVGSENPGAKHAERLERIRAVRMIRLPRGVGEFEVKPTDTEIPTEYLDAEASTMIAGMAEFPYLHDKNTNPERKAAEQKLMSSDCLVHNGFEPAHFNSLYTCVTPAANTERLQDLRSYMDFLRDDEDRDIDEERKCHFYRMDMGNGEFAVKIVIPVRIRDGRLANTILLAIFPSSDQSELIWEGLRSKKMQPREAIDAIARHIHPDLPQTLYTTDGDVPVGRIVRIPETFVNEALAGDRARAAKNTESHAHGFVGLLQDLFGGGVESHKNH